MTNEIFQDKKNYLNRLMLNGFISAMHSHKELFKSVFNDDNSEKLSRAVSLQKISPTLFSEYSEILTLIISRGIRCPFSTFKEY